MGVSVLLADDHQLFAVGIKKILDLIPEFKLIGTVENGKEVILFLENNQDVDVLVLDLNMPLMDGVQVLSYLWRKHPQLKKLILSSEHTRSKMEICKNLGAHGFIGKDSCFESFREALIQVTRGLQYFQPVMGSTNVFNGHWNCPFQKLRMEFGLSERETEILQLVLNQMESREIADQLHLSPLTVKTHRKNIYTKLKVHNVAGLMGLVKAQGF